jgi:hypothetical protein
MAFPDSKGVGVEASHFWRLGGLLSLYRHFWLSLTSVPLWGREWRSAAALVGVNVEWAGCVRG